MARPRLVAASGQVTINPRDTWAAAAPAGALAAEEDVRFLLVHHTAGTNNYGPDEVPDILRDIYGFHTGPERGWPDVAYNFFVDRYGQAWEGRAGSLAGAVQPDATGGSQGFAQLVCFLGDHTAEPPTAESLATGVAVLAMLADRHAVDTAPGATVEFESRGSNRWPAGSTVTAATVSGHRDMSQTACPGDTVYALIADGSLAASVSAARGVQATTTSASTTTTGTSTTTTVPSTSTSTTTAETGSAAPATVDGRTDGDGGAGAAPWVATGAAAAVAATAALIAVRRRRSQS